MKENINYFIEYINEFKRECSFQKFKKKSYSAVAQFSNTLHYTRIKFLKILLTFTLHLNLNFVLYALQLIEFCFSHLIYTNKVINLYSSYSCEKKMKYSE